MASGIVTYFITRRQINLTKEEGRRQRQHELDMAREERRHELTVAELGRQQQRLESGYTSLMEHVGYWSRWVGVATTQARKPGEEVVGLQEPVIDRSSEAFASLVASGEVGRLINEFNRRVETFRVEWHWLLVTEQQSDPPATYPIRLQRRKDDVGIAGEAVQVAGDDLVEKIREELGAVGQLPRTVDSV